MRFAQVHQSSAASSPVLHRRRAQIWRYRALWLPQPDGRCQRIVDIDVAQLAIFCAGSSLFFFSPLVTRQFSGRTTCPCTVTPSTQLGTSGASRPNTSDMRLAIGKSEFSGEFAFRRSAQMRGHHYGSPFVERMTNGGIDARISVSSVILPTSSCGTLRSARINTFVGRSRSVNRMNMVFALLAGLQAACHTGQFRWTPPAFCLKASLSIARSFDETD